jgi:hypothetical protein
MIRIVFMDPDHITPEELCAQTPYELCMVHALYSPDEPEVVAATSHLEAVEQELTSFSQPALAA